MKKIFFTLIPCLLIVAFLFFLRPVSFYGDTSYIIVSGQSMEPTMWTGDMAIVKKQGLYAVDDIIAYHSPYGPVIIHRIVYVEDNSYTTRGDNRDSDDPWTITPDMIVGKSLFAIPRLGTFVNYLGQPVILTIFMVGIFIVSFLPGFLSFTLQRAGQRRLREKKLKARRRRVERALDRWLPANFARILSHLD